MFKFAICGKAEDLKRASNKLNSAANSQKIWAKFSGQHFKLGKYKIKVYKVSWVMKEKKQHLSTGITNTVPNWKLSSSITEVTATVIQLYSHIIKDSDTGNAVYLFVWSQVLLQMHWTDTETAVTK